MKNADCNVETERNAEQREKAAQFNKCGGQLGVVDGIDMRQLRHLVLRRVAPDTRSGSLPRRRNGSR